RADSRTAKATQLPLLQSDRPAVRLPVLDERLRGTKFVSLEPKSVLNSPQQTGVDFWSLNPYIGCEFGCAYCYARYAHRYTAERRFRLTRGMLERLARCDGLNIGIITKSPLIGRDTDVLRRIQERSDLEVHISLNTVDVALIRHVEARSPMPAVRLRALERLADSGVRVGLIVAPVLPGITDDVPHLEALFQAAREAGARFVHSGPLRLYAAVRDRFFPVLDERFPLLAARYRRAYDGRSGVPRDYARALSARIKRLQARFRFPVNEGMADRYGRRLAPAQQELGL